MNQAQTTGRYHPYLDFVQGLCDLATEKLNPYKLEKPPKNKFEYYRLLLCFYSQMLGSVQSIITLYKQSPKWFQPTNALIIARTMIEVFITAKYMALEPMRGAKLYTLYFNISQHKWLAKMEKHKNTKNARWNKIINGALNNANISKIEEDFKKTKKYFEFKDKKKKAYNWANKSIRDMASTVNLEIEYDVIYTELSNYTHPNVQMPASYLKEENNPDDPQEELYWSMQASEDDVKKVFLYYALIYSEFLEFYASQFNLDISEDIGRILKK